MPEKLNATSSSRDWSSTMLPKWSTNSVPSWSVSCEPLLKRSQGNRCIYDPSALPRCQLSSPHDKGSSARHDCRPLLLSRFVWSVHIECSLFMVCCQCRLSWLSTVLGGNSGLWAKDILFFFLFMCATEECTMTKGGSPFQAQWEPFQLIFRGGNFNTTCLKFRDRVQLS